jgi:hypothetical protein
VIESAGTNAERRQVIAFQRRDFFRGRAVFRLDPQRMMLKAFTEFCQFHAPRQAVEKRRPEFFLEFPQEAGQRGLLQPHEARC